MGMAYLGFTECQLGLLMHLHLTGSSPGIGISKVASITYVVHLLGCLKWLGPGWALTTAG